MLKRLTWLCGAVSVLTLVTLLLPAMAVTSWQQLNTGLTNSQTWAVAVDPGNSQTMYAGTWGDGVFKSTNGGASWSAANSGMNFYTYVYTISFDPTNTQIIYAGTYSGGVFKSTNGGGSWTAINTGLGSLYVKALLVDPTNTQTLYAATTGGLFRSTNGGGSWQGLSNGLPSNGYTATEYHSVAFDPTNSQTIYAGTYAYGVCKSTDGGNSWKVVSTGLPLSGPPYKYFLGLAVDPAAPQNVYAAVYGAGVYKTTNGGGSWSPVNGGLTNLNAQVLAVDPTSTQTVYAGTYLGGVFKSTDGGGTWSTISSGSLTNTSATVYALTFDPADHNAIYAATGGGVYRGLFSNLPPPTISGTPPTTVTVGNTYSFTPTATDATSFSITGSIPPGFYFNTANGILSGTSYSPGTYSNIKITALNPNGSAALAPFSIMVLPPPPTISGTPGSTSSSGQPYSFTPTSSNASSFGIANRPFWASFDSSTGALTGTPTNANAGLYSNIVITAYNSAGSASLAPFSITVSAVNHPPQISGAPVTLVGASAYYSFVPTASDLDGDTLRFTIANKPSWASFDTSTGALTGTAVAGSYADVQISVSDGSLSANLPAFSISVVGSGGSGTSVPVLEGWWLLPGVLAGLGIFARKRG